MIIYYTNYNLTIVISANKHSLHTCIHSEAMNILLSLVLSMHNVYCDKLLVMLLLLWISINSLTLLNKEKIKLFEKNLNYKLMHVSYMIQLQNSHPPGGAWFSFS